LNFIERPKMRVLAVTGPSRLVAAPNFRRPQNLALAGMTVTGSVGFAGAGRNTKGNHYQIAQASRGGHSLNQPISKC